MARKKPGTKKQPASAPTRTAAKGKKTTAAKQTKLLSEEPKADGIREETKVELGVDDGVSEILNQINAPEE